MDDRNLAELYRNRFPDEQLARKNEIWKILCRHYFHQFISPTDTVVDVACGYGEFINNISADEKIAVDINPESKQHLAKDIDFMLLAATELSSRLEGRADVVFTSNFLEHLPNKPALELFLEQVSVTLKPGGRYLIMGPNLRYLPGEYWDFYDHHLGLTHASLCEILKLKGFEIERCVDRFLPYTTQGALPTHPIFVRAYLAVPPIWRFLGKQFFISARKPV
ncbi:MAG: methyltransferase domain-containing protein [Halieaceae bacterium]